MSTIKTLFALLLMLAVLAACQSDPKEEPATEFPCTCGTDETAFHGCLHPLCVEGETNPDNLDCVCGTLSIDE